MSTVDATPPDEPPAPSAGRRHAGLRFLTPLQQYGTVVAFFAILAAERIWLGGAFGDAASRLLDVHQNAPILLLGLAVMITLIAGQFDLSIASMASLTATLSVGLGVQEGWSFPLVIALCLLIGLVGGLLNGALVTYVRINAFIATLGTSGIFLGIATVYQKGTTISPEFTGPQLPTWYSGSGSLGDYGAKAWPAIGWIALGALLVVLFFRLRKTIKVRRPRGYEGDAVAAAVVVAIAVLLVTVLHIGAWVDNLSWTTVVLLAFAFVMWVLLNFTVFGRHVRATGGNAEAARLAGVHTNRITVLAFVIGGLLSACAGLLLSASQGAAPPNGAGAFLLPAFAAAFLSTVVFSQGAFTVWGTLIGGMFVLWVSQGLILGGISFTWTDVINGLVLVVAVAIAGIRRRT